MHFASTAVSCIALAIASCVTAVAADSGAKWKPECSRVEYTIKPTNERNSVQINAQVLACECTKNLDRCDCTDSNRCRSEDDQMNLGDRCKVTPLPIPITTKQDLACGCIHTAKKGLCQCKNEADFACACGIDPFQAKQAIRSIAEKVQKHYPNIDPYNAIVKVEASRKAFVADAPPFYSTEARISALSKALQDLAVERAIAPKGVSATKVLGGAAISLAALKALHDVSHWTPEQREEKLKALKSKTEAGLKMAKRTASDLFAPATATAKAA